MTTQTKSELLAELRKLATDWRDYRLNNMHSTMEHIGTLFVHKRNFENAFTAHQVCELFDFMDAQAKALKAAQEALRLSSITVDNFTVQAKCQDALNLIKEARS